MVGCSTCIHSRLNSGTGDWCRLGGSECIERSMHQMVVKVPTSPEQCGDFYPEESDIPNGLCLVCGCSTLPTSDGRQCPLGAKMIKNMQRDEVIVVGSRYYQPPQDEMQTEQLVPFPVLMMEE